MMSNKILKILKTQIIVPQQFFLNFSGIEVFFYFFISINYNMAYFVVFRALYNDL